MGVRAVARRDQDLGQQMLKDAPASDFHWDEGSAGRGRGSSSAAATRDIISVRAPARETAPAMERPAKTERPREPAEKEAEHSPAAREEKPSQSPRKGWLRRHPVLAPVGLV